MERGADENIMRVRKYPKEVQEEFKRIQSKVAMRITRHKLGDTDEEQDMCNVITAMRRYEFLKKQFIKRHILHELPASQDFVTPFDVQINY